MTDSQQAAAAPLAGGPDVPACERPDHVDAKLRAAYAPGE